MILICALLLAHAVTACGPSGATELVTITSGPNGNLDWLNCHISTWSGWNPPLINLSNLICVPLDNAIRSPQSPFTPCSPFLGLFNQHALRHHLPPIILAALAMQESSCNPHQIGPGGEQGLMQLSQDKCLGAPGGDCKDVNFNIRTAAQYFADTLNDNDGNLLLTIGTYNGWYKGLTIAKATAAAKSGCCMCQNNLDYLHQVFNGWFQNIDPRATGFRMGKYFNLDKCL